MINQSSAASWGAPPAALAPVVNFLVRRRVNLTIVLIAIASAIDLLVGGSGRHAWLNPCDPLVFASALSILAGLLLRSWAAGTIRKWEQLATTGPYAIVRHPLYLGSTLMTLGFCGLMSAPLLTLAFLAPLAGIYWLTIQQEESVLALRFADWPAYAQRVPRLRPRRMIWPQFGNWSGVQWLRNKEYCAWLGAAAGAALLISRPWWPWLS